MANSVKTTVDTKSVEKVLINLIKKTEVRKVEALSSIGTTLANSQRSILRQMVQNWTGRLSDSIRSVIVGDTLTVGGSTDYTDSVEDGHGTFRGYHFMRKSYELNRVLITNLIKKIVKL